jgi:hypothetical protein
MISDERPLSPKIRNEENVIWTLLCWHERYAVLTIVAEPHHFDATPAAGRKNFAAPASAPTPFL